MRKPERARHQRVLELLSMLSDEFLEETACYFGGGTRIVLELHEYRESLDIDFLCSDQQGYRELRNQVTSNSLGRIFAKPPSLTREVKADLYGIRTYIDIDSHPIKFEIIREARIDLKGTSIAGISIPCLDQSCSFAEKLLANTDRGLDKSTRSRDLIDLAFMAKFWNTQIMAKGLEQADAAYGPSVLRSLNSTIAAFHGTYKKQCLADLDIGDRRTLEQGLVQLTKLIQE